MQTNTLMSGANEARLYSQMDARKGVESQPHTPSYPISYKTSNQGTFGFVERQSTKKSDSQ